MVRDRAAASILPLRHDQEVGPAGSLGPMMPVSLCFLLAEVPSRAALLGPPSQYKMPNQVAAEYTHTHTQLEDVLWVQRCFVLQTSVVPVHPDL